MTIFRISTGWVAVLAVLLPATIARAQSDSFWIPTGSDNYNVGANWTLGAVPDAQFDERAIINNGGTAVLTTTADGKPSEIILGQAEGDSGTLEIGAMGNLTAEFLEGTVGNGGVSVGQAGTGTLTVLPGGTLSAVSLSSGGNQTNTITIGGTETGTATVDVSGNIALGGTTRIRPNASLSAGGQIMLQSTGNYVAEIADTGHSIPTANLSVVLGGTLTVEFTGITPSVGDTWNLFEAGGVGGAFDEILSTPAVALGPGERWVVNSVPTGENRRFAQLTIDQFLTLTVNRNSGEITLGNPGGMDIEIDGYTIGSAAGSLSPTNWNSLDDQNALGDNWRESNPTSNNLTELKPTSPATLNGTSSQSLGSAFDPNPDVFLTEIEDLTFQYRKDGQLVDGRIEYVGTPKPNNLLLTVDPTTGEAQLKNTSPFDVEIDGYTVSSASNALLTDGWNSLDDQDGGGGDWRESNASASRLSELKPTGQTSLSPGASFGLGNLFDASGSQDLIFEFLLAGEEETQPTTGVVFYGPISTPSLAGDYNQDGAVDAADYVLWRDSLGSNTTLANDPIGGMIGQAQYDQWKSNFGASGGNGNFAAIPEPTNLCLLLAAVVIVGPFRVSHCTKRSVHSNP